jgi:hypothetical protein
MLMPTSPATRLKEKQNISHLPCPTHGFLRVQVAFIIPEAELEDPRMHAHAANAAANPTRWPNYREGDFVIRNYVFRNGETLPELKQHSCTPSKERRITLGVVGAIWQVQDKAGFSEAVDALFCFPCHIAACYTVPDDCVA